MPEARIALLLDGVEIPAVLTLPERPRAAMLLIPGSFNIDQDGNMATAFPGQPPLRTLVYKQLAGQLAGLGVATLRFSKRGPGTECVTHDAGLARERYRFFPQRVVVAAAFLDELARRAPGLPLLAAGHSEGAVVATLLAREQPQVRGLVLLSGPSLPLLRLLLWQQFLQDSTPDAALYQQAEAWAKQYAAGGTLTAEDFAGNRYAAMFPFYLQPSNEPYLRSLEQADPAAELARVTAPVLIVQGGRDGSVMAVNADRLLAAQPRATVAPFPELQHFYKRVPDGMAIEAAFSLEGESDPAVARAIAGWADSLG